MLTWKLKTGSRREAGFSMLGPAGGLAVDDGMSKDGDGGRALVGVSSG